MGDGVVDDRGLQQVAADPAAAAIGPEQGLRAGERSDLALRAADLLLGDVSTGQPAERHGMAPGVVADPVALALRPLGQRPRAGPCEPLADHEEGR